MKITFFNDINFLGGGELWVLRACHYLKAQHHQPRIICPQHSALAMACLEQGIDVYTYSQQLTSGSSFRKSMDGCLKHTGTEILYCTVMGRFCEAKVLGSIVEEWNDIPGNSRIALILKTGLPPMGELSPEYYGAGAGSAVRRLHVVSNSVKKAFFDWQPPMDNGFIEIFYEGIDGSIFDPERLSKEESQRIWQIPPGHTLVSCIARLEAIKGQSVLLRAIPAVLEEFPDTLFLLAGEGKEKVLLKELADDLQIREKVRFTGHLADTPSLLKATDILCHPSLNDGIPNAIIEAMFMEVFIVASDLPGIREVLTPGESGMLVRAYDVQCLSTALIWAMRNLTQCKVMVKRAKELIAGPFHFQRNMEHLLASLEKELLEIQKYPVRKTAPKCPKPSAKVNVLFIMNEIRLGGEETELGILPRYLDRQRYHLSILSCYPSTEYAPVIERLRYYDILVDVSCNNITDEDGKIHYIIEKIRREGVNIVVACQNTRLVYEVFQKLSPDECKLIEHGGVLEDIDWIPKDRTSCYIGVSRIITEQAARLMKDPGAAVFLPSMVDTDEYDHPEWANARSLSGSWLWETLLNPFGYPEDACVVVFLGRLDPKKHVEDLIRAARRIREDCPEAFFLIIGGTDSFQPGYSEQLLKDAADLIESGYMAFTGPRSDVPGLLSASHILVLPSTGEGMAHVINEAGAAGLAVIATDDGAAREQLDDGKCGVMITPRNISELADALKYLIKDKPLRRELGQRLKTKVKTTYSAKVVIAKWHKMFETLSAAPMKPQPAPPVSAPL